LVYVFYKYTYIIKSITRVFCNKIVARCRFCWNRTLRLMNFKSLMENFSMRQLNKFCIIIRTITWSRTKPQKNIS
jgi:hypothetical protein